MQQPPIIEIRNMHKTFPGVHALKGVNFTLFPGEVHALVGENGAGKSTLIKIMSGANDFTEGSYYIDGQPAHIRNTLDAIDKGIGVIYQELNLVGSLSVAENIYFGRLPNKGGRVQWKELHAKARHYLDMVGLDVSTKTKVQYLSIAQQQLVEIAKALALNAKVIIMDEPTSALSPKEIDSLFDVITQLKTMSVGIVYVSHKLDEIFAVANRITVLRDGLLVKTIQPSEVDQRNLIVMMVGRPLSDMFPEKRRQSGSPLLEVKNLCSERIENVSFHIDKGEIVGFSGLMGAGRTELTFALYGLDKRISGEIFLDGQKLGANSALLARAAGIGLVPEDRKTLGILPHLSVRDNLSIVSLDQVSQFIHIRKKAEEDQVQKMVTALSIRTPSLRQFISKLSGGNQQKIVLGRWLMRKDLKLLIIDEPTRGIDVGAKAEIYTLLNQLARQGLSIMAVSSELPEILGLCDRIYVMKDGRITGEFQAEEATEAKLLERAIYSG